MKSVKNFLSGIMGLGRIQQRSYNDLNCFRTIAEEESWLVRKGLVGELLP
jgi:hypothetical protein